jgi:hypothetical protein
LVVSTGDCCEFLFGPCPHVLTLLLTCLYRREGIRTDTLDEVERRYVHPDLKTRMMKEAKKPAANSPLPSNVE